MQRRRLDYEIVRVGAGAIRCDCQTDCDDPIIFAHRSGSLKAFSFAASSTC